MFLHSPATWPFTLVVGVSAQASVPGTSNSMVTNSCVAVFFFEFVSEFSSAFNQLIGDTTYFDCAFSIVCRRRKGFHIFLSRLCIL